MKSPSLRIKRWPAVVAGLIFIGSVSLWIDSNFNARHFIFLPGGDVRLGFGSSGGFLQWVEYAPWSPMPQHVYSQVFAIPYSFFTTVASIFLSWYLLRKIPRP
jgi:hypothetical protein